MPILPKVRDPRLITVRRGGSLTDEDHRLLAEWAVVCAEHVLHLFVREQPDGPRPRQAITTFRSSPWRFGPLFWMTNNDETTSAGMRSATDATRRRGIPCGRRAGQVVLSASPLGKLS